MRKRTPSDAETCDLAVEVGGDEVDPVPAAGAGSGSVGHGAAGGAGRSAEQQPQVAAAHVGEGRPRDREGLEPEVARVEVQRRGDVVDHVADVDGLVVHVRSSGVDVAVRWAMSSATRSSISSAVRTNAG